MSRIDVFKNSFLRNETKSIINISLLENETKLMVNIQPFGNHITPASQTGVAGGGTHFRGIC